MLKIEPILRHLLEFEDGKSRATLPDDPNGLFKYQIKLPEGLECDQCILQVSVCINQILGFCILQIQIFFSGTGHVQTTGDATRTLKTAVEDVVPKKLSGDVLT